MMNALLDQYHDNSRKPYKMTSISINNTQQLLAAMSALEQQMATIRAQLGARSKTAPAEIKADKPKRELSAGVIAWNQQVQETLAQMKTDGWKHPQTGKEPIYRDARLAFVVSLIRLWLPSRLCTRQRRLSLRRRRSLVLRPLSPRLLLLTLLSLRRRRRRRTRGRT